MQLHEVEEKNEEEMKHKLSVESAKNLAPKESENSFTGPVELTEEKKRTTSMITNIVQPKPPTPINPPLKPISFN